MDGANGYFCFQANKIIDYGPLTNNLDYANFNYLCYPAIQFQGPVMKSSSKIFFILFLFFVVLKYSGAQTVYDFGFKKDFSISVLDSSGAPLDNAWGSGMNSCHFSAIDLNLDGVNDLVSFDKTGNKLLTFINNGISDSISYTFDPYYRKFFPELNGWVHFIDYNNDQKNDIFTYTPGGIMVYKNISDTILKFQLLYPMLNSDMGSSVSNISVTYDDYPAIFDIDNDGDLDILCFFGLGTFIQMHQNLSQELFSNSDTLLYELSYYCWGDFTESSLDNTLNLDIECPWRDNTEDDKATRHTGSTMLADDFNGDGLTDLILGDVDYFNLIKLTNGGTADSAHMVSQDTLFPSESIPVNFNSFPVPSYLDLNNDSKKDLLVSPFSSVYALAENTNSVWLYKNTGSTTIPNFSFVKPDFLQGEMIETGSGCYPVVYDYNSDGLQDIILGNYGYLDSSYYDLGYLKSVFRSQIAVLENNGSLTNPSFQIVDNDYADLSQLKLSGLVPTFGDLDHDGDMDMICGNSDGSLIYFENTAGSGNIPIYNAPVFNFQAVDVGDYSVPQLFDLNSDNLLDLAVGKKNGTITYFQNTGSINNPVFTKITDNLGQVNVTDPGISVHGYSSPCFFTDSNKIKLFTGSEKGSIFYYKNIESNLGGKFTAVDSVLIFIDKDSATNYINDGMRSGVAVFDFNNDGYQDMVTGNFSGGLSFYYGTIPHATSGIDEAVLLNGEGFNLYPNPANTTLKISFSKTYGSLIRVEIYDIIGNTVLINEGAFTDELEVELSGLKSGFYICKATAVNNQKNLTNLGSRKFVIIR